MIGCYDLFKMHKSIYLFIKTKKYTYIYPYKRVLSREYVIVFMPYY